LFSDICNPNLLKDAVPGKSELHCIRLFMKPAGA
jgi:hypothetical protein